MTEVSFSTASETDGTFTVPAYTMAVFVKTTKKQGAGLSADATVGAPDISPYGGAKGLSRGDLNEWGLSDQFEYVGSRVAAIYEGANSWGKLTQSCFRELGTHRWC